MHKFCKRKQNKIFSSFKSSYGELLQNFQFAKGKKIKHVNTKAHVVILEIFRFIKVIFLRKILT